MRISNHRPYKKVACAAVAGVLSLGTLSLAAPAQADITNTTTNQPSKAQLDELYEMMAKFSTPAHQQEALVQKAMDGIPWDVYGAENEPVVVENDQIIDGFNYTIKRYADGSVAANGFEIPVEVPAQSQSAVQPFALSGCKVASGSGYRVFSGCQVDGWWGSVRAGAANMTYTLVQGAYDKIDYAGYGFQSCLWPTSCSSPVLVENFPNEDGRGPGYVKWQADVSSPAASWNVWVKLHVGGDRAWDSTS